MTHIGPSVVFDGTLTTDEDITIDGQLSGSLHVRDADLTIGRPARVDASLRAHRVVVFGTVRGTISASERIELTSSAVVTGDISATHVVIAEGARFNGRVDMGRRTIAARVAQYQANQPAAVHLAK
jgi:cytoskeletal protein CcmA (bactofilin family)